MNDLNQYKSHIALVCKPVTERSNTLRGVLKDFELGQDEVMLFHAFSKTKDKDKDKHRKTQKKKKNKS